jgi:adenylylsulfate kinase-like enzyme|tara:strand:+ start:1628 stop:2107 length:480 start_codon:yes stop_codon:yes gene_type:complete
MILWFTGQPGSGKTTLADEIQKRPVYLNTFGDKSYENKVFHIDGDDLRYSTNNKDYSEKGRRENVKLVMDMVRLLDDKGYLVIVSMVSPYRDQREELKMERNIAEFYCHTTDIRGKEDYFVEDYEPPLHNFVDIDTTNKEIKESVYEVLVVYRKMADVA